MTFAELTKTEESEFFIHFHSPEPINLALLDDIERHNFEYVSAHGAADGGIDILCRKK